MVLFENTVNSKVRVTNGPVCKFIKSEIVALGHHTKFSSVLPGNELSSQTFPAKDNGCRII